LTGVPRNRPAYAIGFDRRRVIRLAMLDLRARDPFATITAKAIRAKLPWLPISDGAIRFHMRAIKREARSTARQFTPGADLSDDSVDTDTPCVDTEVAR